MTKWRNGQEEITTEIKKEGIMENANQIVWLSCEYYDYCETFGKNWYSTEDQYLPW
jgi:hypothetical protein